MAEYTVGQVLYIIPADAANVVPVQVIEQRISKTVEGTAVKHIVKSPKPKAQPMILETIKGHVYSDIRVARDSMVRNATMAIDAMIKHAHNVAQQAFAPRQIALPVVEDDPFDTTNILIDEMQEVRALPDMRQQAMEQPNNGMQVLPPSVQQSTPPLPHVGNEEGLIEIMLPDGSCRKVKPKVS